MVPVFWGVCCYVCVVWCVVLYGCRLKEEPVIYAGFRWDEGVCAWWGELCEACGFAEAT